MAHVVVKLPQPLLRCGLLAVFVAAFLFASTAKAQEEATLAFLDERPLLVTLPAAGEEATVSTEVLNRSAETQTIRLRVVGLANAAGDAPPNAVEAHEEEALVMEVAPAAVATFTLTFVGQEEAAPPYEGRLLAYGSEGDFDRLPITLQAPPAEPEAPSDNVAALGFLSDFPFRATRPVLGGATTITSPLPGLTQAGVVGAVVGPGGDVAPIRWQDGALTIEGLDRAGQYKGALQLAADEETTVTVAVRDHWLWALLVLGLGLLVAQAIHWYTSRYRPQKELEARIDELLDETWAQQEKAVRDLPQGWPWSGEVFRIVDEPRKNGLLVQVLNEIRDRFLAARSQAERDEWHVHGKQFERARAYAGELEKINGASREIFVTYTSLKQTIMRFEDLPVAQASLAAIKPRLLQDATEMGREQARVSSAAGFLDEFGKLHLYIYQLEQRARENDHKLQADNLRKRLESAAISAPDFLPYLKAGAQRLEMDIAVAATQEIAKQGEERKAPEMTDTLMRAYGEVFGLDLTGAMLRAAGRSRLQELKEMALVRPIDELDAEGIREKLQRLDWGFRALAGLIAVTTGFHILYLSNPTFGSAAEYFGLLLWSTTVDEGLRVARQMFPPLLGR